MNNRAAECWASVSLILDPEPGEDEKARAIRACRFLALVGEHTHLTAISRATNIPRTTLASWSVRDDEWSRNLAHAQRTEPLESPDPGLADRLREVEILDLDAELARVREGHPPSGLFREFAVPWPSP